MPGTSPAQQSAPLAQPREIDVVVIGGGQAGLAAAYALRRTQRSYVVLDAEPGPGGAWRHTWESLTLFSPARWSSLPGWILPGGADVYPSRTAFLDYVAAYEARYRFPIERPVWVTAVERSTDGRLQVVTDRGDWRARAVISSTGSWRAPVWPLDAAQAGVGAAHPDAVVGLRRFRGEQLHSANYLSPLPFVGQRVLVLGGRNSAAQIYADLLPYADVSWVARRPPTFLPDDADGRVLFEYATQAWQVQQGLPGAVAPPPLEGDIVLVPPLRAVRAQGLLVAQPWPQALTPQGVIWPDGREERVDTLIWCTGFRPALHHLDALGIRDAQGLGQGQEQGHIAVEASGGGVRAVAEPRLWLLGYGEWTGYASATLAGIGRAARSTVQALDAALTAEDTHAAR